MYAIVALDTSGIGITLPILPRLLSEVAHTTELGWRFGAFLSIYALMQFVFSPLLGAWSDRIGRRPVLLFSLVDATVDYLLMAAVRVDLAGEQRLQCRQADGTRAEQRQQCKRHPALRCEGDRYAWTPLWVGISLACFGLLHAFAQAFIAGPLAERWGERGAILTGVVTDVLASVLRIRAACKGCSPA